MKVVSIPISKITGNPEQPRKIFKKEELEELMNSIAEYGILQPIIVAKAKGGGFIVIAGERRLRAAKLAGLRTVPAIIKDMPESEAAVIALVENVQRADLNFLEEAQAYKRLMEDFDLTQEEIAAKVNKNQSTISNKIRVLSLPDDVRQMLIESRLTERHARALLKLKDDNERRKVVTRVVNNNLNVKQTEKLIDDLISSKEDAYRKQRKISYISYKIYLNTIRKTFNQIKEMEKNVKMSEDDYGEFLEIKITIPKNDRCFT